MPFANIGPTLLSHLGEIGAITLHRYAGGIQDQTTGHFTEGAVTNSTVDAVVNPYERRAETLREGEVPKVWIEVFTTAALRDARTPNVQADEITWTGRLWRIMECDDWTVTAGYSYSRAMLIGRD